MKVIVVISLLFIFSCKEATDKTISLIEKLVDSSTCMNTKCNHYYQGENILGESIDKIKTTDSTVVNIFQFMDAETVYFKNDSNEYAVFSVANFKNHGPYLTSYVSSNFYKGQNIYLYVNKKEKCCVNFKFKKYKHCTFSYDSSTSSVTINYLIPPIPFQ